MYNKCLNLYPFSERLVSPHMRTLPYLHANAKNGTSILTSSTFFIMVKNYFENKSGVMLSSNNALRFFPMSKKQNKGQMTTMSLVFNNLSCIMYVFTRHGHRHDKRDLIEYPWSVLIFLVSFINGCLITTL